MSPRYGLAVLIGAAVGTPGAAYLLALHHLIARKTPAAVAVIAVLVFVTINLRLVIVPAVFEMVRPEGTEGTVKRFKDWTVSHERQIAAAVALLAGAFMVITGALRVLN
jgi:Na+/phosphate symporter